ncbi:MAG: ABC transporter permease, partial [Planctomycetota bacterium]
MIVWNALLLAFRQIARNKLRAFLTTLGITIGVASVIAMVSLGQSATASVNADLADLGQNLLFVVPGAVGPGMRQAVARPFSIADASAIGSEVADISAVAPVASTSGTMVFGNISHRAQAFGVDNAYLTARQWKVQTGAAFTVGVL